MKRSEIIDRAEAAVTVAAKIALPIVYALGRGGDDHNRHVPWDAAGRCDCSGFVAWCLREPRMNHKIPGGWIETSMMYRDAMGTQKMFRTLKPTETPETGDLLVYGDHNGRQGHVGVVSYVVAGKPTKVIHCSVGNDRIGPAIRETETRVFEISGGIVARLI